MLQLRAFAFPEEDPWLDSELQRRGSEFPSLCKEVVNGFGIVIYRHKNRVFYSIPSWNDHQKTQRQARPRCPAPDDPESMPDLRFSDSEGISERTQGTSERTQGNVPLGTGKGKGKGKREREQYLSSSPCEDSSARRPDAYPPAFEEWWKTYPRRRNASKKDAAKQWREATKTIDPAELLRLTASYAENPGVDDVRYIPHPHKWLKDRRWESTGDSDQQSAPSLYAPEGWRRKVLGTTESAPPVVDAEVLPWQLEA